jgi:hypothetical protein
MSFNDSAVASNGSGFYAIYYHQPCRSYLPLVKVEAHCGGRARATVPDLESDQWKESAIRPRRQAG